MTEFVAAIDQGTTSTRCIVFDAHGGIVATAQKELTQHFPRPGWVEHDAGDIWRDAHEVTRAAIREAGLTAKDVAAIGITNQRETVVVWDRRTGEPVHRAVVWQDTRSGDLVAGLAAEGGQDRFRDATGLPLATYFSGPKVRWLLDEAGLRDRAERGELACGTVDSWLIYKLTGRHLTDVTNASRTMLMNLSTLDWDDALLDAIGVPRALLPEIRPSVEIYGEAAVEGLAGIPVAGALGDQQAALFGQTCFAPGEGKNTYGTGSFLLLNTGTEPVASTSGLVTTLAYRIGDAAPVYALEGSIAITGALVQWLRDNLGIISSAAEIEDLASTVDDTGGCYVVPAFSGLYAPHWRSDARGVICGLTRYVTKAHLARAVLEATCWQTREVAEAMRKDAGVEPSSLKVDGGMTVNSLLMQLQADILGVPVIRPAVAETTALGAAYAGGLAVGLWPDVEALRAHWRQDAVWHPGRDRDADYAQWRKAVERSTGWID